MYHYNYLFIDWLKAYIPEEIYPDILNQYGPTETAGQYRATSFHELGHSSHYSNVGELYWRGYRDHIIFNGGYGSFGSFNFGSNPGKVALGEAVGNDIGYRYGNSLLGSSNPHSSTFGGETNQFRNGFIPTGLLWDLEDSAQDNIVDPNNSAVFLINENITGFTPEQFFIALTPSVINIELFGEQLKLFHLNNTTNNSADYDELIEVYDVFNLI